MFVHPALALVTVVTAPAAPAPFEIKDGDRVVWVGNTLVEREQRYGYWEASIKWGDTNGMWSAYWMQSPTMGANINDPVTSGSEIDIGEHRSTDGGSNGDIINQVQNNIHWNGYGSYAKSAGSGNIGSGLGSGYHTNGFLWTPTDYTIYLDGSNVRNWNYSNNGVPVSAST